jgi:AAA+ superfamily predicted ATPase
MGGNNAGRKSAAEKNDDDLSLITSAIHLLGEHMEKGFKQIHERFDQLSQQIVSVAYVVDEHQQQATRRHARTDDRLAELEHRTGLVSSPPGARRAYPTTPGK